METSVPLLVFTQESSSTIIAGLAPAFNIIKGHAVRVGKKRAVFTTEPYRRKVPEFPGN